MAAIIGGTSLCLGSGGTGGGIALHRAVHHVYAASPWYAENALCAAYAVAHHLLCTRVPACWRHLHRLKTNAVSEGKLYTDAVIPQEVHPEGYAATWCSDPALLSHKAHDI